MMFGNAGLQKVIQGLWPCRQRMEQFFNDWDSFTMRILQSWEGQHM